MEESTRRTGDRGSGGDDGPNSDRGPSEGRDSGVVQESGGGRATHGGREKEKAGRIRESTGRGGTKWGITRWADRLGFEALGRFSWRREWAGSERPWRVSATTFPEDGTTAEQVQFLLRFAVLAPSSHNTQPWLFNVTGEEGEIRLFADSNRWLTVADPDKRELYLSLGAALENVLVAADHYGLEHDVRYLPGTDSAHAATVRLSADDDGREPDAASKRDRQLFDAIPRRRTNRSRYRDQPIPRADLRALQEAVVEDDVTLQFVADRPTLDAVADLAARADRRLFADPEYRRELGEWIGRGAFGDSWVEAKAGKYLISTLNVGPRQAQKDRDLLRSTPLLAVVRTKSDSRRAQIRAGQVFERVSLLATALGVQTHPTSAPLEVQALRRELTDLLGNPEWPPQHLFRLGYADDSGTLSPRRPVEAVLVD